MQVCAEPHAQTPDCPRIVRNQRFDEYNVYHDVGLSCCWLDFQGAWCVESPFSINAGQFIKCME